MERKIKITYKVYNSKTVTATVKVPERPTPKKISKIVSNIIRQNEPIGEYDDVEWDWNDGLGEPKHYWGPDFPGPDSPYWVTLSDGSRWVTDGSMLLREGSALPLGWPSAQQGWRLVDESLVEGLLDSLHEPEGEGPYIFRFSPFIAPVLKQGTARLRMCNTPWAHGVFSDDGELLAVVTPLDPRGNYTTQAVNSRGEVSSV